jgi:hypothetical protein
MTNHFHLLLSCPEAGLSEAMQSLQFRYAQWFNHRYDRDGPLFRGRFTSVLVQTDEQLATVGRYIHRNPLDVVGRSALSSYRWSSLACYLGVRRGLEWLHTGELLQLASAGDADRFREFVEVDVPSDSWAPEGPLSGPTCDDVEAVVNSLVEPARASRPPTGDATKLARALAITLCVELRVAPSPDLAVRYGLASPATIRTIARRGRLRIASDPAFADLRRQAVESLRTTRGHG